VLCEKFAHTRFEPSGWTGNPEIGYAKSIMDYIFRWIQMRFLSGQQLDLFAGLTPLQSVPVEGTVTAPGRTVNLAPPQAETSSQAAAIPSDAKTLDAPEPQAQATPRAPHHSIPSALASLAADVSPQAILQREQRGHVPLSDQDVFNNGAGSNYIDPYDRARTMQDDSRSQRDDRTPPQHGIAPAATARAGAGQAAASVPNPTAAFEDRGVYDVHPSNHYKDMYEVGDSPSCATCGAIMTRSGSCYRCMSCGSTSGCS
jgi:ribonucleoside-diphosphate reductase alpha chain